MAIKSTTNATKAPVAKPVARTVIATGEFKPSDKEEAIAMVYVGPEVVRDNEQTGELDPRSKANVSISRNKAMRFLDMDADGESVLCSLVKLLMEHVPDQKFVEALNSMDELVTWYLEVRGSVATATLQETKVGEDISGLVMEAMTAE